MYADYFFVDPFDNFFDNFFGNCFVVSLEYLLVDFFGNSFGVLLVARFEPRDDVLRLEQLGNLHDARSPATGPLSQDRSSR